MSGNYAFRHAVGVYYAPNCQFILILFFQMSIWEGPDSGGECICGVMYCAIILGANKTTISVATGHVETHPFTTSPLVT